MEKSLSSHLSFSTGARFWYMSSTASMETWRREDGGEGQLVKGHRHPFVVKPEEWNLNVSVNQVVGFKVIVVFSKWINDEFSHLQIRNDTLSERSWSPGGCECVLCYLQPAGVEEVLQQRENRNIQVYFMILVALVRVQELTADQTEAKEGVNCNSDHLIRSKNKKH